MDLRVFLADHFTAPMSWPVAAGLGLLVVLALEVVYRLVLKWLKTVSTRAATHLDDVLVRRMRLPAQVLVFLVGANVLFAARGVESAAVSKGVTLVELLLVAYLVIEALAGVSFRDTPSRRARSKRCRHMAWSHVMN